jgi:hypothetical protein
LNADVVVAETRAWLERAVIGLNLCPFAKAPHVKRRVRFVVSEATDTEALLAGLVEELTRLAGADEGDIETTLLVHPRVLADFADYNNFLGTAESAVTGLGLEGVVQVASFHPQYCFAGSRPEDIDNATNRSPYPTLHLLREASVTRAVDAFADASTIFETNIATMRRLGAEGWAALQQQCRDDAASAAESSP